MATRNTIPFRLPGFAIDDVHEEDGWLRITAHATAETAPCPACETPSRRVHSYYTRSPCDLPCIGRAVRLVLRVRRFRCLNAQCTRQTFAERVPAVAPRYARRTARLTAALRAVGFRMSSEAGAGVLKHLQVHISADTLLRLLRRTSLEPETTPRVLGIDDWAKRKGHTYGTVLVDLERHRVVDLLPERESEAVAQWLQAHPGVEVICRDRAEVYAEGAAQGAPDAVQVADRWHLAKNLGEALQRVLERHLAALRAAARQMHERTIPAPAPAEAAPGEQTSAATAVSKASTRRQRLFAEVKALAAQGYRKRAISLHLHIHRQTVDRYLHADTLPPRQQAPQNLSTVTPYLAHIQQRWAEGCQNGRQLWREIQAQGFTGSYASVTRALKRFRQGDGRRVRRSPALPTPRPLSPRQAMWLLVQPPDALTPEQETYRQLLCACCAEVDAAYPLAQRFMHMIRQRQPDALDPWLEAAQASAVAPLRNFAVHLRQDYAAVKAALTVAWSNGQTEGQVNRLKLIKRQMYGRAQFDLLRQRLLYDDS